MQPRQMLNFILGTNHKLRKQVDWVGGLSQMLTFSYKVGGWVKANAYISKMTQKFAGIKCQISKLRGSKYALFETE